LDKVTPIAILLATIKMRQNNWKGALAVIEKGWEHNPCQALAQLILNIQNRMQSEKFIDIARRIAASAPRHYESHLLLARAALDIDKYDLASHEIGEALSDGHKVRACQLMAEFCMRTHGNNTEALSWLHYAVQSKNDTSNDTCYFSVDDLTIVTITSGQRNLSSGMLLIQ
jgi:HemY protein